jgi:nucleoside-diphosphate-sugar epimerase
MRIVVFGAGGFVGGSICEEFSELGGFEILACVRRWASAVRLSRRGLAITQCDLGDGDRVTQAVADAHIVVNATALPSDGDAKLNANLFKVCTKVGVRKFVHVSSAVVFGNLVGEIDEDNVPVPNSDYSRGKLKTEMALLDLVRNSTPELFILRPSIIYGPFSDAWSVRYARRIANGHWRSLGPAGTGTCNAIHVRDLARFIALVAKSETTRKSSHILNLNGPDIVSWNEYIERFGDALDITDRNTPGYLQFQMLVLFTELVRNAGSWTKKRHSELVQHISHSAGMANTLIDKARSLANLYPTIEELSLLRRKAHYSSKRSEQLFGFRPSITLEEGLRETANWCRVHGVI